MVGDYTQVDWAVEAGFLSLQDSRSGIIEPIVRATNSYNN